MTTETSNKIAPDAGPLGFPSRVVIAPVDGAIYLEDKSMKEIQLTQGKVTLVDDEDFERISKHNWQLKRKGPYLYAARFHRSNGSRTQINMHREILGLCGGHEPEVHHKNEYGLDNRKENLEILTTGKHRYLHGRRIHNTSGYRGVGWDDINKRWRVRVQVNGIIHSLGHYKEKELAIKTLVEWIEKEEGK